MSIPDQALDGRLAIVGITGSGKSTTAKGGVERLLATGRRVCVVDLLDAWWGLRLARDAFADGFSFEQIGNALGNRLACGVAAIGVAHHARSIGGQRCFQQLCMERFAGFRELGGNTHHATL